MAFTAGFCVGPTILGVDFNRKSTTPLHPIGLKAFDNKGRKWVYVKANGTIAAGKLVKSATANDPYTNVVIATASAGATAVVGMTPLALAAGDYAWIVQTGMFEDSASLGTVAAGEPFVSDAGGAAATAAATDINNAIGVVLVDNGATGSVLLDCVA